MIFSALLLPTLLALPAPQNRVQPPPGLVKIEGGNTTIGSTPKEITEILDERASLRVNARALDAETPQHKVRVGDFFLMVTELTNEQYRAFVAATGQRPPRDWANPDAQAAATNAFLEAEQKKKEQAEAQGQRYEKKMFDVEQWWDKNWRSQPWEVPAGQGLRPVVFVDFNDATAYCRWAGLRLPSEEEFQRAVRGDGKDPYPWGDDWKNEYAATSDTGGIRAPFPVGQFPEGKTKQGLFDLVGNVWEWTSSPYVGYPDFAKNEYKVGTGSTKEVLIKDPRWDANQRVSVGGSFGHDRHVARATVRRPCERSERTNALGFRSAATARVGADIAEHVAGSEVAASDVRPDGVKYLTQSPIAMDRWEQTDSSGEVPEGYQIITGYDYVLFVPAETLEHSQSSDMDRKSLDEPVHLGFLATDQSFLEPALGPGTFLVAYRAAGKKPRERPAADPGQKEEEKEEEQEPAPEAEQDPLESLIDITRPNFIFYDASSGEIVATLDASSLVFEKTPAGGNLAFFDKTIWVVIEEKQVQKSEKWLKLEVKISSSVRDRSLICGFELKPEPDMITKVWRK